MSLRKVFCGVRIVYVHFGKRMVSCILSRTLCGLCQSPYTYAYTCTHIYIYIYMQKVCRSIHIYMYEYTFLYIQISIYIIYIYIYIYIRLWWSSSWFLLIYRLMSVPPIPMPRGQDFSSQGAGTIEVYLYKYTSIRRSSPGKLCVASAFGNCVLSALVLSFWVPSFGSRFWPDRAHGPLGQYVLHHLWDIMCCISAWKLCVASPLGDDGVV